MANYTARELANAFRTVRRNTIQVAEDIPEAKYDFVPAPGTKSVSELLRHIAFAPMVQIEMHREQPSCGSPSKNAATRQVNPSTTSPPSIPSLSPSQRNRPSDSKTLTPRRLTSTNQTSVVPAVR